MDVDTLSTFWVIFPHDPIFVAPPITEVQDYVWGQRYTRPINAGRWFSHPDAEMAKMASLNQEKRYFNMTYQQIKDWMENYEIWD